MSGKDSEDSQIFAIIGDAIRQVPDIEELVYSSLVGTHDDWTERSSNIKTFDKKISKNQLHQYNPLELIGWKEATADLLFIEPILNACGINIDLTKLQEKYDEHVISFLEEHDIKTQEDLRKYILSGEYEALQRTASGQEFYERLKENPELLDKMIANLEEKGIRDIEQFVSEHKKTVEEEPSKTIKPEEVARRALESTTRETSEQAESIVNCEETVTKEGENRNDE